MNRQKEVTKKIEKVIPEVKKEEELIKKQGQWDEHKKELIIDIICQRYGIYKMRCHVFKIINAKI